MTRHIQSVHNATLRSIEDLLRDHRIRRKLNSTILEGVHLCALYLEKFGPPTRCVYALEHAQHPEIVPILARLMQTNCDLIEVNLPLFQSVSSVVNGLGLLFEIPIPKIEITQPQALQQIIFVDQVQDPGNMGTIIRTAAAAGVDWIGLNNGCASAWSPKVMRAAMGGHFYLQIQERCNFIEHCTQLRDTHQIIAAVANGQSSLYQFQFTKATVWLLGSEGSGLAQELLELASHQVTIPLANQFESLNVATATAIFLFERQRQLAQNSLP